MEFKLNRLNRVFWKPYLLFMLVAIACTKEETEQIKVKAPLRDYVVTARLDNKQADNESNATGILKGTYSEKTKLFTYTLNYENLTPLTISINKGIIKGAMGTVVIRIKKSDTIVSPPLFGEKRLSSLEERDLIKGLWFVTIGSAKYSVCEIRGQVTIKKK